MKQIKTFGRAFGFPSVKSTLCAEKNSNVKMHGFSGGVALFGCALMLSLQAFSNRAGATVLAHYSGTGCGGTCTTITSAAHVATNSLMTSTGLATTVPCGSGGLSGLTMSNSIVAYNPSNPHVYFGVFPDTCYDLMITGFTAQVRSSATGPMEFRFAYSLDNGHTWHDDGLDHATSITSCGAGSTVSWNGTLNVAVPNGSSIMFALYPYSPLASSGTVQFNDITISGTVNTSSVSVGNIFDDFNGTFLNGEIYGYNCNSVAGGPIQLSCTPAGGIWGATPGAMIDPAGELTFDNTITADKVVQVAYIYCNVAAVSSFTVSTTPGTLCDGTGNKPARDNNVKPTLNDKADIAIYPNPANTTLSVSATEKVNVSILSADGKELINEKNAKDINISGLANGAYIIQMYNDNNILVKTTKFVKQ